MMLEKIAKAMSDKNRLEIMQYLSAGQRNVTDVADKLNVEENLASHHLRVLCALGFLKNDKRGREVFYKLNDNKFMALIRDIKRNPAFRDLILKVLKED
jgi:ArsR family transcriptional regulator, arsenate/arsenite/antimonite-responsive transcriptional repressor